MVNNMNTVTLYLDTQQKVTDWITCTNIAHVLFTDTLKSVQACGRYRCATCEMTAKTLNDNKLKE